MYNVYLYLRVAKIRTTVYRADASGRSHLDRVEVNKWVGLVHGDLTNSVLTLSICPSGMS